MVFVESTSDARNSSELGTFSIWSTRCSPQNASENPS